MIHFLFDENVPVRGINALQAVGEVFARQSGRLVTIQSLLEYTGSWSIHDDIWVPKAASDGCLIITADRAKQSGGKKITRLCALHRATHVLMGAAFHDLKQFEKLRLIVYLWPDLVDAADGDRGARYSMQKGQTHPILKRVPGYPL